jgi:hypothetical protein
MLSAAALCPAAALLVIYLLYEYSGECAGALHGMYGCPEAALTLYKDTYNKKVQMRSQFALDVMILAPRSPHTRRHARKARTTASIALADCLLGVLLVAAQVGSAQAYACTSNADCQYPNCNDMSCSSPWYSSCNNGVWDAICVSITENSETQCHSSPLHSQFPILILP